MGGKWCNANLRQDWLQPTNMQQLSGINVVQQATGMSACASATIFKVWQKRYVGYDLNVLIQFKQMEVLKFTRRISKYTSVQ